MDLAKLKSIQNVEENRFELAVGGEIAIIDYKIGKSGNWYLVHTEVPDKLKNHGVGNKLVRESLNILAIQDVRIIPSCPFVRAFIKRHKDDYAKLLADGVKL